MSDQARESLQRYVFELVQTGISGAELLASVARRAQKLGIHEAQSAPLGVLAQSGPHHVPNKAAASRPPVASSAAQQHQVFQQQIQQMQQQQAILAGKAQPAGAPAPGQTLTAMRMAAVQATAMLARLDSAASSGSTAALPQPARGKKGRQAAPGPLDAVAAAAAAAARGAGAQAPEEEEAEEEAGAAAVSLGFGVCMQTVLEWRHWRKIYV